MPEPAVPDLPCELVTRSEAETRALGRSLAPLLEPGTVVYLHGDLGAGKTVFCRGIAEGLGVDPARVRSPSFNLLFTYEGRVPVHHVDLYRLENEADIVDAGLEDALWDREAVTLVEWAERLGRLPRPRGVEVLLSGAGDDPRPVRLAETPGHSGQS